MSQTIKAVLIDISGVLYEGNDLYPGALDTLETLRKADKTVRFVTNTATRSADQMIDKLRGLGFQLEEDELFTAPDAARAYVDKNELRPYALVHESIQPLFESCGNGAPNCVVLGDARDAITYESLNQAFQLCVEGAPLVAIGYNRFFSKEGELWLDAGAFVKALTWAADCDPIIAGKPGKAFFEQVVASTDYEAEECLMVGDDLEGDIIGACNAGLQGCLVRTGKFQETDEENLPAGAAIIDSVASLIEHLGIKKAP